MQLMAEEAERMGFSAEQARLLVQQTALGSAQMVINNPQLDLETLRAQVTSKGGTTAEAIRSFQEQGLAKLVSEAMRAAVNAPKRWNNCFKDPYAGYRFLTQRPVRHLLMVVLLRIWLQWARRFL
jgi:pyrroline-5-carboxylate reductase